MNWIVGLTSFGFRLYDQRTGTFDERIFPNRQSAQVAADARNAEEGPSLAETLHEWEREGLLVRTGRRAGRRHGGW